MDHYAGSIVYDGRTYTMPEGNANSLVALRYDAETICVSGRIGVMCESDHLSYIGNQPVFKNNKLHIMSRDDDDNCGIPPIPGPRRICPDAQMIFFEGMGSNGEILNAGTVVEFRCPTVDGEPPAAWNPGTILCYPYGTQTAIQVGDDGIPGSLYTGFRDHTFPSYQRRATRLYRIHLTHSNSIRKIVLRGSARFMVNSESCSMLFDHARVKFEAHNSSRVQRNEFMRSRSSSRQDGWFGQIHVVASARARVDLTDLCCDRSRIRISGSASVHSPTIRSAVYCEMAGDGLLWLRTRPACLIETLCSASAVIHVETVHITDDLPADNGYRLRQFRILDQLVCRQLDLGRSSSDEVGPVTDVSDMDMSSISDYFGGIANRMGFSTPAVSQRSSGAATSFMDRSILDMSSTSTSDAASSATSAAANPTPVVRRRPNLTDPEVQDPDGGMCVVCDDEHAVVLCAQCDTLCVCSSCCAKLVCNGPENVRCPLCRGQWRRVDRLKPKINFCAYGGCGRPSVIVCHECYRQCVCIACCAKILDHEDPTMRRCPASDCSVNWELCPPVRPRRA